MRLNNVKLPHFWLWKIENMLEVTLYSLYSKFNQFNLCIYWFFPILWPLKLQSISWLPFFVPVNPGQYFKLDWDKKNFRSCNDSTWQQPGGRKRSDVLKRNATWKRVLSFSLSASRWRRFNKIKFSLVKKLMKAMSIVQKSTCNCV